MANCWIYWELYFKQLYYWAAFTNMFHMLHYKTIHIPFDEQSTRWSHIDLQFVPSITTHSGYLIQFTLFQLTKHTSTHKSYNNKIIIQKNVIWKGWWMRVNLTLNFFFDTKHKHYWPKFCVYIVYNIFWTKKKDPHQFINKLGHPFLFLV